MDEPTKEQTIEITRDLLDEFDEVQVATGTVLTWDGRNYVGRNPRSGFKLEPTAEQVEDGVVEEYIMYLCEQ